uniref:Putative ovule protein n=1 Tax=Solanum chacoense TaxID=4108 RepID=A0A0V0H2Q9_SOLCH
MSINRPPPKQNPITPNFFDIPAATNSSAIHLVDVKMSLTTCCLSTLPIHCSNKALGSSFLHGFPRNISGTRTLYPLHATRYAKSLVNESSNPKISDKSKMPVPLLFFTALQR